MYGGLRTEDPFAIISMYVALKSATPGDRCNILPPNPGVAEDHEH